MFYNLYFKRIFKEKNFNEVHGIITFYDPVHPTSS